MCRSQGIQDEAKAPECVSGGTPSTGIPTAEAGKEANTRSEMSLNLEDDICDTAITTRDVGGDELRKSGPLARVSETFGFFFSAERNDTPSGGSTASENETTRCNLCLIDFVTGDDVCTSRNPGCSHVYHQDCILEWLMDHDNCPNCGLDFLFDSEANKGGIGVKKDSQLFSCAFPEHGSETSLNEIQHYKSPSSK
eukprot:CAMPEP_0172493396 /NCGR_PEP_ID=MMETSP1066-20121228/24847_1 /TAXON_ID=671091 /ORGANISM="Coscinodiscus wailesii, Strain CCMP2513" /LENGTH=195 /DNA_ID=CAMNT_0013263565 /DNA_START=290 /DNA_END=875 /DNA_ORIENTATION=+